MRTRIIALVVAVILAVVGGVLLFQYVRGADQRAADGAALTSVLVVTEDVPAGTSTEDLALFVEERDIPTAFLAEGAVPDLDALAELDGLVTTSALVPGEQVVEACLATAEAFVGSGGSVPTPEGMQQVSISLDAPRVVGGKLVPGDLVGIYVSVEGDGGDNPRQTKLILDKVLVTNVVGGATSTADPTASGTVTVTFAVTERQAQEIIYAREFASLWLTKQNEDTDPGTGTPFIFQELVG